MTCDLQPNITPYSVEDSTIRPPTDKAPRHVRLRSQMHQLQQQQQQQQQQAGTPSSRSRSSGRRSTTPSGIREAENYEATYQIRCLLQLYLGQLRRS